MGRTIIRFIKYQSEYIPQAVDFVNVLEGAESIQSASVTAYDRSGNDVTSTLIDGTASINGTAIEYVVQDGTAGDYYWIDVEATLDTSEVAIQRLRMSVPRP
jgi:hypothetical protein